MDIQLVTFVLQGLEEASKAIIEVYNSQTEVESKLDGSPVTNADIASHQIMKRFLSETNISLISEEDKAESYSTRKNYSQVWILDPLDGTKEFIKKNGEFVICLALVEEGKATFGAIAYPCGNEILIGGKTVPPAIVAFDNISNPKLWKYIQAKESLVDTIKVATSRSHFSEADLNFVNKLRTSFKEVEFVKKGSALKFFDLTLGKADVYPRFAPTMEWDIAAGQAIIEALGGEVLDANSGKSLHYNKEDLTNPHFIVRSKAYRSYLRNT